MNDDWTCRRRTPKGNRALLRWLLVLAALNGCSEPPAAPHPLRDRIFDTDTGRELHRPEIDARLEAAEVVYLGEAHDEPAHHEAQMDVLRRLVSTGRRPAVGFEIFTAAQTHMLQEYSERRSGAGTWLRNAAGWAASDDPNWDYYATLLEYVHAQGLKLFGMDLDATLRHRITRGGLEALSAADRLHLHLTDFRDAVYREVMLEQLAASHCGYGDEAFLGRLYDTWVARNDAMAASIVQALEEDPSRPVVAILGAGHTGYGMGVMERVAHLRPGTHQLNIALRSVKPDATEPEAYYGEPPRAAPHYPPTHEIIWLTRSSPGRLTDEERCTEAFGTDARQ